MASTPSSTVSSGIDELADSLRAHGLLQPVVVRRRGAGYELVAGHRRLEAAKQVGWTEIAAVVRDETDDQAYILTLVENLQREDLTPKEEAAALEVLVRERGWSTRQVGEAIKRSHIYVSRRLRVFEDPALAPLVLQAGLAVSTAEELLRAPDAGTRQRLAAEAAAANWTPGDARQAVARVRWNESFQDEQSSEQVAERIRALREELARLEAASLPAVGADLVIAALHGEIAEAWRLMHQWRAKVAAHQAVSAVAYVWQAESQAHDLERQLRALLRVRRRARQLAHAAR